MRSIIQRDEPALKLYGTEYCYYCVTVRREAKKLGFSLKIADINEDRAARQRLIEATGRTRVPVLGIYRGDGCEEFLPESEDIIRYLRKLATSAMPTASDQPV